MSEINSKDICRYEGKHFGAPYPDAKCFDGYLWDLDSCDEPGGLFFEGGDIPCPNCNREEYQAWKKEQPHD